TSSSAMDRAQNAGQTRLVHALLKTRQDRVAMALADDAGWTELYNYLNGPRDRAWEDDNLGPYLQQTFDIEDVFIVSRDGHVVYDYRAEPDDAAHRALPGSEALERLAMSAFVAQDANRPDAIAGVVSLGGVPAMAASLAIRPSTVKAPSQFAL